MFRMLRAVPLAGAKIGGEPNLRGGVFEDRLVLERVVVRKLVDDEECRPELGMLFLDGFQYEEIAYGSPVGGRIGWYGWSGKKSLFLGRMNSWRRCIGREETRMLRGKS